MLGLLILLGRPLISIVVLMGDHVWFRSRDSHHISSFNLKGLLELLLWAIKPLQVLVDRGSFNNILVLKEFPLSFKTKLVSWTILFWSIILSVDATILLILFVMAFLVWVVERCAPLSFTELIGAEDRSDYNHAGAHKEEFFKSCLFAIIFILRIARFDSSLSRWLSKRDIS